MNTNLEEKIKSQVRKGLLEFCILLVIGKGKIYASEIIEDLERVGLTVVEGTIYPLLSRFKLAGLVSYTWEESPNGPPRKYYSLTSAGEQQLNAYKGAWGEMEKAINLLFKNND